MATTDPRVEVSVDPFPGDDAPPPGVAPGVLRIHGEAVDAASVSETDLDRWRAECLAAFPSEPYQVLYADPPWRYRSMGPVKGKMSYPTMTLTELKALPVARACAPTCVLFLWCTNPLLTQALDLMKAWGFEYRTVFKVWLKRDSSGTPVMGCGWWSRPSTELLLVGTRGQGYMKWKAVFNERQEHESVRRAHSEKPAEIRDAIARFFPGTTRLELFARHTSPGFDAWGLEVPGFYKRCAGDTSGGDTSGGETSVEKQNET